MREIYSDRVERGRVLTGSLRSRVGEQHGGISLQCWSGPSAFFAGSFTMDGGSVKGGFRHTGGGDIGFLNAVEGAGTITMSSTWNFGGHLEGNSLVIDCSGLLKGTPDPSIRIDTGTVRLDNLPTGSTVTVTGLGGTLQINSGVGQNAASFAVVGFVLITDELGNRQVPNADGSPTAVGNQTFTGQLIAAQSDLTSNLVNLAPGAVTVTEAPNLDAAITTRAAPGAAMTLADGAITAAKIATDALDANGLAADAVAEIQAGLATAGGAMTLTAGERTAIATAVAGIEISWVVDGGAGAPTIPFNGDYAQAVRWRGWINNRAAATAATYGAADDSDLEDLRFVQSGSQVTGKAYADQWRKVGGS